jgi:cyclic pyranopterin phosphate synthase
MREDATNASLGVAIREAMTRKPEGHDFKIERRGAAPAVARSMSTTGG